MDSPAVFTEEQLRKIGLKKEVPMVTITGQIDKGCITDNWRSVLVGMVERDIPKEVVVGLLNHIPRCEDLLKTEIPKGERKAAVPWGIKPVYVDEEGKHREYDSLSSLIKELGEKDPEMKMSGTICDLEGKKCRATTAVEILQIRGYKVDGNGEPRKASEGGKKLTIYHPSQEIIVAKPTKRKKTKLEEQLGEG